MGCLSMGHCSWLRVLEGGARVTLWVVTVRLGQPNKKQPRGLSPTFQVTSAALDLTVQSGLYCWFICLLSVILRGYLKRLRNERF